jgi:hypothetical protein
MYKVHLEWQTRVCQVDVASSARQFRRYFDRFEGRVQEPPYAVCDDLTSTQETPPEKNPDTSPQTSPGAQRDTQHDGQSSTGGVVIPTLGGYREQLRGQLQGLQIELERDDSPAAPTFPEPPSTTKDFEDLYNTLQQPPAFVRGGFADPFTQTTTPFAQATASTTFPQSILSPFNLGITETTAQSQSHHPVSEMPDFLFEEGDLSFHSFGDFDDFMGDLPDLPGLNTTIVDQDFLAFLNLSDTTQP